jgi:putative redox protein
MAADTFRSVDIDRIGLGHYAARNVRGGTLEFGTGDPDDPRFSPVELLLIAIAGCTGADVDYIVTKRAEPITFSVRCTGDKIRDEDGGNRLVNLAVEFAITFPEDSRGDAAREMLPRAVAMSHDRLCTVSRTVLSATPIATRITEEVPGT